MRTWTLLGLTLTLLGGCAPKAEPPATRDTVPVTPPATPPALDTTSPAPQATPAPAPAPTPAQPSAAKPTRPAAGTAVATPGSAGARPAPATPAPAATNPKPTPSSAPTVDTPTVATAPAADPYHPAARDTLDVDTYQGWKQFELNCSRCHGEYAVGSSFAPALIVSLREGGTVPTKEAFISTVCAGRLDKGMPSWCALGLEMEKIQQIYLYVKGRADGKIAAGRPAQHG